MSPGYNDICLTIKMPYLYFVSGVALNDSSNAVMVRRSCQLLEVNFTINTACQVYNGKFFCSYSPFPSCMVSLSKVSSTYFRQEIFFVVCHDKCMFYTFARDGNSNIQLLTKTPCRKY